MAPFASESDAEWPTAASGRAPSSLSVTGLRRLRPRFAIGRRLSGAVALKVARVDRRL